MTALCGGGTSSTRPGVPQNVAVAGSLINAGLEEIGPWLIPFSAIIDGFLYEAVNQCTHDPPPPPVFDLSDVANLVGGVLNPNLHVTLTKINNGLLNFAWYRYCQCDAPTATPAPPPPTSQPGATGTGQPQASTSCFTGATSYMAPVAAAGGPGVTFDITTQLLPGNTPTVSPILSDPSFRIWKIPPGITGITYQAHQPGTPGCGATAASQMPGVQFFADPSTHLPNNQQFSGSQYPAPDTTGTITIPPSAVYWIVVSGYSPTSCGTPAGEVRVTTDVSCAPGSGALQNCCPPDPSIAYGLNQILAALQTLYSTIPVRAPNYVASPPHTGLTGLGTLVLASTTIALKVEVTTLPAVYGEVSSLPLTYIDIGWITPVTNEGPESGFRLTRTTQVIALPEATSAIDYSLEPGQVVSISELQAG